MPQHLVAARHFLVALEARRLGEVREKQLIGRHDLLGRAVLVVVYGISRIVCAPVLLVSIALRFETGLAQLVQKTEVVHIDLRPS